METTLPPLNVFLTHDMKVDLATYSKNAEELAEMSMDSNVMVRCAVARNRHTPNKVLVKMIYDKSHASGRTSVPFYIKRNKGAHSVVRLLAGIRFNHVQ